MAVNPDLHLWRSVLVSGLHDAAQAKTPQDAAWIGSPDFVQVCTLAGVDPDAVIRAYQPERFMRIRKAA